MTNKPSPLIEYEGKCPLCRQTALNRYVKSKTYRVAKSEPDHHPLELEWQNPEFEWVKPQHFFVWACPACHYADTEDAFRKGDEIRNLDLLRDKYEAERQDPTSLVARLGPRVNLSQDEVPNHQALNAHILAVAAQELLTPSRRNHEKIGRLYLRIGWLYREAEHLAPAFVLNHALLQSMAVSWPRLPLTETQAAERAIESYRTQFDQGGGGTSSKKDLALLLLLGRLNERIGNLDEAADYCRVIFETAMSARQASQQGAGGVDAAYVNRTLDGLQEFKDEVETKIIERDQEHIDAVVAKANQAPLEELMEELKARGAHLVTQQKLREMLKAASTGQAVDEEETRAAPGLWERIRNMFRGEQGPS